MIGGFRKNSKRGNLRKKVVATGSDEEEGEVDNASPTVPPSSNIPAVPRKGTVKIKKSSSKTTLSFGDELENDGEFIVKRTKASLSIGDPLKKEKKRKKKKEKNSDDILMERSQHFADLSIKTFNDEHDSDSDNSIASHRFSISNKMGMLGAIPDAATIYAMKKKREQARKLGGQVNYIPLNKNKYEGRFASSNSRLVREDIDNDSSGDERIEMKGSGSASHPALERRNQVAKALEEVQDVTDQTEVEQDDDEVQRWEDEQIKKGSQMPTNHPDKYGPKVPESNGNSAMMPDPNPYSGAMLLPSLPPPPPFPLLQTLPATFSPQMFPPQMCSIPNNDEQNLSVEVVAKKLAEQLDTKKQLHSLHERQREKTAFDLQSSKDNIVVLERKAADASDRFTFYQDIHGFVRDLIECLNEKVNLSV